MSVRAMRSWDRMIADFADWMAARGYSPRSIEHRTRCLRYFLAWAGPRAPLTGAPSGKLLRGYTVALAQHRTPANRPLALITRASRIYALRGFIRWLCRSRGIGAEILDALEPPRLPRPLPRDIMNVREVEQVLRTAATGTPLGLRDRALLETLYSTALRRGELAMLAVTDIDRSRRLLLVREGKGGHPRFVPLGRRAIWWLGRYLRRGRPRLALPLEPALFVSRRGRALTVNRVGDLVRSHVRGAGVAKRGSCHMFRHTVASLMLERGADVRFIQELLGHQRLTSTQVYTRVSIGALQAVHRASHPAEGSRRSR